MTRTFKLTIAYDGTDFAGWQVQPGQQTIQGWIQGAIECLTGHKVTVVGSGRTDAGVHAFAQVASCTLPRWSGSAKNLADAINTKLPESIAITAADDAVDGFHAIRDAVAKRYRYQIRVGGGRDVFDHRYRWLIRHSLNVDAMRLGAQRLIGERDFASFQASGAVRKSTTRIVAACDIITDEIGWESATDLASRCGDARLIAIEVEANGFLYNMVRNIVGTLVEVARGKYEPEWIDQVIAAKNRDVAGPTAPAHGLFLKEVSYGPASVRAPQRADESPKDSD